VGTASSSGSRRVRLRARSDPPPTEDGPPARAPPRRYALGHRAIARKAEFLDATWWCGGDAALADESACAFYRWVNEDFDHPPPVHVTPIRLVWEELEPDDFTVARELHQLLG